MVIAIGSGLQETQPQLAGPRQAWELKHGPSILWGSYHLRSLESPTSQMGKDTLMGGEGRGAAEAGRAGSSTLLAPLPAGFSFRGPIPMTKGHSQDSGP